MRTAIVFVAVLLVGIGALLVDRSGAFGISIQSLTPFRVLSVLFVAAGAALFVHSL